MTVTLGVALAGAAGAQGTDQSQLFACVGPNGFMRLVAPGVACEKGHRLVSWSIQGPPGEKGEQGLNGVNGLHGTHGQNGLNGVTTVEVVPVPITLPGPGDAQPAKPIGSLTLQASNVAASSCPGPDATPIVSFSANLENALTLGSATGGSGAGKAKLGPVVVTKALDAVSPRLMCLAATGLHFDASLELPGGAADGKPVKGQGTTYELETVFVTKLASQGSMAEEEPRETVELVFGRMRLIVDGTAAFCWDQLANPACQP